MEKIKKDMSFLNVFQDVLEYETNREIKTIIRHIIKNKFLDIDTWKYLKLNVKAISNVELRRLQLQENWNECYFI